MNDFLRPIFHFENKGSFITQDVFETLKLTLFLSPKLAVISMQNVPAEHIPKQRLIVKIIKFLLYIIYSL